MATTNWQIRIEGSGEHGDGGDSLPERLARVLVAELAKAGHEIEIAVFGGGAVQGGTTSLLADNPPEAATDEEARSEASD